MKDIPGQISDEEAQRLAREWQEQQDHASDILPEGGGRMFESTTVELPKIKIVGTGIVHLHRPRDVGTPSWMDQDN